MTAAGTDSRPSLWGEFATPLYSAKNPNAERLNPKLRDLFLSQSKAGDTYANKEGVLSKQVSIFESSWDVFKWQQADIQELKKFCMEHLWMLVREANGLSLEACKKLRLFSETWYHVTDFGGFISSHSHPNASWSGVYMVDPGDTNPDFPDSGVLSFKDPRQLALAYLDPANMSLNRQFHIGSMNFKMEAGDLMLFPSYLYHEVYPYMGKRPRITLAFNCSFKQVD